MRRLPLAPILAALLTVGGLAHAGLPEPVAQKAAAAGIPEEAIGVLVLRGDQVLASNQADRPFAPGSTMKLLTTLVGLEQLGPTFRGRTELLTSASIERGVLQGDLILRGGGDGDFTADALTHMLEKLRRLGIRKIDGNLIVDRTLWQPARLDVGLPPFDEAPEAYYNAIPDALWLNMNMLNVELTSDAHKIQVSMLPEMEKVDVRSALTLIDGDCAKWESGWLPPSYVRKGARLSVLLKGTFPRHCSKAVTLQVLDRHDYTERLFRSTWTRLGGSLRGAVLEAETVGMPLVQPAPRRMLAEHVSRTLPELVRDTNKSSDNGRARALLLSLGSLQADPELGSRPQAPVGNSELIHMTDGADDNNTLSSTLQRADAVVRNWLHAHQIDDQGLVLENGSGLSRTERASPLLMAGVLRAGLQSLWAPEFQASLPIAGTDGTMRRRLTNSPAALRARIKTGTLNGIVAIAGYVPDAQGQPCIVVALINHPATGNGAGRGIADALIDWAAQQAQVTAP
jgi:D-alanyl-D-alanine carboxypeptidase/D-alanyl-D-alanine-endopeptidase (penicillin-binding protein 4)